MSSRRVVPGLAVAARWANHWRGIDNPTVGPPPAGRAVVVIAPHPDDEVLGAGGALALLADRQVRIEVVFLTDGTRSVGAIGRPGASARRRDDARRAAGVLGIPFHRLHFLGMGDTALDRASYERLGIVLGAIGPDVVYLPWPLDPHPDHRAVLTRVADCLRLLPTVGTLVFYEATAMLTPTHLVDIGSTLERKLEALACYRSLGPIDYGRAVEGLARARSLHLDGGHGHAEAFAVCAPGDLDAIVGDEAGRVLGRGHEAEVVLLDDGSVLKRWHRAERSHRAVLEAEHMATARALGVPVPSHCELGDDGRSLRMERLWGHDLHREVRSRPWTAWGAGRVLGVRLARLHELPAPPSMPRLDQQIGARLRASGSITPTLAQDALTQLASLTAQGPGDRLCHGNFHLGNLIATEQGPVIIDWADAAAGAPEAELAQVLVRYRVVRLRGDGHRWPARLAAPLVRMVLRRAVWSGYRSVRPVDVTVLRRWESVRATERLADGHPGEARRLRAIASGSRRSLRSVMGGRPRVR